MKEGWEEGFWRSSAWKNKRNLQKDSREQEGEIVVAMRKASQKALFKRMKRLK